jgi:hypothetical protein
MLSVAGHRVVIREARHDDADKSYCPGLAGTEAVFRSGLSELSSMRKLVDLRAGKQIGADTVNIA